jgi:hypothetical protein
MQNLFRATATTAVVAFCKIFNATTIATDVKIVNTPQPIQKIKRQYICND